MLKNLICFYLKRVFCSTYIAEANGNTVNANGANANENTFEVSGISFKAPPFWRASPELWFKQVEAQFEITAIRSDSRKFYHVVAAIESEILTQVVILLLRLLLPTCMQHSKNELLSGYYRRFVKNFSQISKPLTNLLKKDADFNWNDLCREAFTQLKQILLQKPLLQYPDFSRPFIVTTNASNVAIEAILSQGPIGSDLPISYISRTLNKEEANYSTTEKELLAIVWALKQFRPYIIYGHKLTVVTDHKPLTWLCNFTDPGARLVRWRLKLEEYEYDIVY